MAVNSSEDCQNVHSIVVLPDKGTPNLQNELPLNISYVEVPTLVKSEMCLNSEPDLQNQINIKVDKLNNYAPSVLDVDIEKGKAEIPMCNEESGVILKSDDSVAKAFQREICFQIGGKFMQLLMKHGVELPKFTSRDKFLLERVYETPTNRSRKYKRSPSFNSRRVVLLFSVLSSMGTIILIYLTLRVRQISDVSGNV
ncbi:uncharacterized protein LOC105176460 isoform X2 [Sesamum indicum]|uniref:Uncharacterized protein LOC105176460 isoform X2 n=1 Tax=Sesamum indicum TaxID=4182 RepID=A0A6I9UGH0_SESIN|nr:uncharacterized protein LOC105176460 isoform X2 [Sesamum indicum]